jgi:hypothetical protein
VARNRSLKRGFFSPTSVLFLFVQVFFFLSLLSAAGHPLPFLNPLFMFCVRVTFFLLLQRRRHPPPKLGENACSC